MQETRNIHVQSYRTPRSIRCSFSVIHMYTEVVREQQHTNLGLSDNCLHHTSLFKHHTDLVSEGFRFDHYSDHDHV